MSSQNKKDKNDLALSPFLKELENRIDSMSHDELKILLMDHAKGLGKKDRSNFLEIFETPPEVMTEPEEDAGTALIENIDAFIERLESGAYIDDFHPDEDYYDSWDHDDYHEHTGGDESWVTEMDDLFSEAAEYFLAADMAVAAKAYEKLLKAFLLEEENTVFCGPKNAQDMVNTELLEAKARYFRALYESTPMKDRVNLLFDNMVSLCFVSESNIGLKSIIETRRELLFDLDTFLSLWIEKLEQNHDFERGGLPEMLRWLLREAIIMKEGTEGLAELAKKEGDVHPEAYDDWVTLLLEQKNYEGAIKAALEGFDRIADGSSRASLADRLSEIALKVGDEDLALEARIRAWRSYPSLNRLLSLCTEGNPYETIIEERIKTEFEKFKQGEYSPDNGLKNKLELLAGDYESAIKSLENANSLGWSEGKHPGRIVFPFLLVAGSGKEVPPPDTVMAKLWDEMDKGDWSIYSSHVIRKTDQKDSEDTISYKKLLQSAMLRHPVTEKQQIEYLDIARQIAKKRMAEIVSKKFRKAYERAATVMVACAEAYHLADKKQESYDIVRGAHEQFRNHRAFRDEMDSLVTKSPLLTNEWMRKK
jgi:hypothetical protein